MRRHSAVIKHMVVAVGGVLFLGPLANRLCADPIEWKVTDGGNGHFYDLVLETGKSWSASKASAERMVFDGVHGHLAAITSQEENDFIEANFPSEFPGPHSWVWLGGYQDRNAPYFDEPRDGWRWITDEPWEYTNWHPGEPNNERLPVPSRSEDYLTFYSEAFWNDLQISVFDTVGFYVEFEPIVGDFNDDALLTELDIDFLSAAVRSGVNDAAFDLNGDGNVNHADRTYWVEELAGTFIGDADLNKVVEFVDFLALSHNFAQAGGWALGDFDGNGAIAFPDFLALSANFGRSNANAEPVPEPASLVMSFCAILVVTAHRRYAK